MKSAQPRDPRNLFQDVLAPKLIEGNSLLKLQELPSESFHLVLTDPPYFLDGMDHNWNLEKLQSKTSKAKVVGGLPVGMRFDAKQGKAFEKFYNKVAQEIQRLLVPGGFFLSFSQPRLLHRMGVGVEDAGFEIRDQYAWHYKAKTQGKAFSQEHFVEKMNLSTEEKASIKKELMGRKTPQLKPQFESILLAQKPKVGTFVNNWLQYKTGLIDYSQTLNGKKPTTLMWVEKPKKEKYNFHPTTKPLLLMEHLIQVFSLKGQCVLDPFAGSGTTLIAAQKTGRQGVGIEINPQYISLAKKRLEKEVSPQKPQES